MYGLIVAPHHRPASSRVRVTSDHVTVTTLLCFRCFISDVSCRHARLRDRSGDKSKAGDDYDDDDDDDDDDCLITQPRPRTHRAREQELWQHCTVQMPGVNSVPIVRANFGHPLEVEAL